jgi:magnesium chelatase family protein
MYGQISTLAFVGIEARPVEVQVRISSGAHAFAIVGLPDKAVAESRERVRNALHAVCPRDQRRECRRRATTAFLNALLT